MDKVIILGAGIYQVPLIKKVKEMGYEAIVASIAGEYPGFAFADKIYFIDTTDENAILELAKEEDVKGILTTGTDVAVVTIGKVCDALGLNGISYDAAKLCTDKSLMKKAFKEHNVRSAKHSELKFNEDINNIVMKHFIFPVMYKAVDSSGSRGIIKVQSITEMDHALNEVKKVTKKDYFIVEEFIEGYEIGVEAFIKDGDVKFIEPHGKYTFHGDADVPLGHYFPFCGDDALLRDIEVEIKKAIFALKLNNCAINADVMIKDNQAYLIEVGGRAGATCLPELLSRYYGIDYYEWMIKNCLNEHISFDLEPKCAVACELLISNQDGVIVGQSYTGNMADALVSFDYKIQDRVKKFHIGPDRIGHMIASSSTLEGVERKLRSLKDEIKLIIE